MVSVDDVSVSFSGGTPLLDHISFHINDGDKIGLVGKNGAGKSTLMKIICGLQNPGADRVLSEELPRLRQLYRKKILANIGGFSAEEYAETAARLEQDDLVHYIWKLNNKI